MSNIDIKQLITSETRLAKARTEARARVNTWRNEQEQIEITFEFDGHTWDAGLASQTRITPLLKLEALPDGFFWTDANNNDVPVTLEQLQAIGQAMNLAIVNQGFLIHEVQRQMKETIDTLTDVGALDAFVPGWPT